MKVGELIEKLQAMPADADVLFDTEAAQFRVHMVSVDSAFYEEEPRPHCGLHTKEPREYTGARDRKIAAVIEAAARWHQAPHQIAARDALMDMASALNKLAE